MCASAPAGAFSEPKIATLDSCSIENSSFCVCNTEFGSGPPSGFGSGPRAAPRRGSSAGSGSNARIPSQIGVFRQEARFCGSGSSFQRWWSSHLRVLKSGTRAAPRGGSSAGSESKSSLILRCALDQQEHIHIF